MSIHVLSLTIFVITALITPGPNNITLASEGIKFGFWRSLPHIAGLSLGIPLLVLAVGLGLGSFFGTYPLLSQILKYIALCYMVFLAYKIVTTSSKTEEDAECAKPMSFIQALAFQWVNPKVWIVAIGAISIFATSKFQSDFYLQVMFIALVYGLGCIFTGTTWALLGVGAAKLLKNSGAVRLFNYVMATLMLLSACLFLVE